MSRHAKRMDLAFADRAVLYDLKRQAIWALCRRGELRASSTKAAPWTFGGKCDVLFPHLRQLTGAAVTEDRAMTGAELRRAGRTSAALPFVPRSGSTLTQRLQLRPLAGWLVGFSPA